MDVKNLKQKSNGEYVFYSAEMGNCVQVSVSYVKGGMNPFSGGRTARGVYVSLIPVKLQPLEGTESGKLVIASISDGIRACVMPLGRVSQKAIDTVALRLEPIVKGIAEAFKPETKREVMQEVVDFVSLQPEQA